MSKKATVFAVDITSPATLARQRTTRDIERGALVSLCVNSKTTGFRKGSCFIRVGVQTGGQADEHTVAVLIDDYIYDGHFPHWNGEYILAQQSRIFVDVWSSVTADLRVNGTINVEE